MSKIAPEVLLDIRKWGNSLGVRLPAAIAKAANLRADQRVRVSVVENGVLISPAERGVLSLEERLARFDATRHGGEAMPTDSDRGAERW